MVDYKFYHLRCMEGLLHVQVKDPAVFVQEASELWQLWVPRAHSSISTQKEQYK